eukprot:1744919-Pleurochrysis_carterae.AAC.1
METIGSAISVIHLVKLFSSFNEATGQGHPLDPSSVSLELLAPQVPEAPSPPSSAISWRRSSGLGA